MTKPTRDDRAAAIIRSMPADDEPVRPIVSETTEMGGVIRLEYWPGDGYVLWYHGRAVWKSWEQPE